jgi:hypothetical protein
MGEYLRRSAEVNGQHALLTRRALCARQGYSLALSYQKTYGGDNRKQPEEHIWVYDEAQRAWDAERVSGKRGHGASGDLRAFTAPPRTRSPAGLSRLSTGSSAGADRLTPIEW